MGFRVYSFVFFQFFGFRLGFSFNPTGRGTATQGAFNSTPETLDPKPQTRTLRPPGGLVLIGSGA